MSRLGTNPNVSSDALEARMLPDIEKPKPDGGSYLDLTGTGANKIYMHRGQLDIFNFGSKTSYVRAARGFGKTSLLGIWNLQCVLGLARMMGLFLGASAKQIMCRTMPNVMKIFNQCGFPEGLFYFRGQAPAKLRWEMPLAKPRVWENVLHFANGACIQAVSMAVRGSCNGINSSWISGDETKYMPWARVKEEAFPTLRGDFMPTSARKTQKKQWGYGTDPKINNYYCAKMFVSDAGLTARQCEWEKEEEYETRDVNDQIAEMLAELHYLEKTNPKLAVQLAQNEAFLKQLHLLRSQSESFWNFSSLDNLSLLGGEAWLRQMKRELPDLLFRIQILGQKKGAAKDGFYSNFDIDIHGYSEKDADVERLLRDRYTVKTKGRALDVQKWPTDYETEALDYNQCQAAAEDCSTDTDLDYDEPLYISIDCNANINCMIIGQKRVYEGRESIMIQRVLFVQNERKLLALCGDFSRIYAPYRRRGGTVIFYFTSTIKQGASMPYAVEKEKVEDFRFDKVVVRELVRLGWRKENVIPVDMGSPMFHEQKYRMLNSCLAFAESPAIRICADAGRCDYLITAIENAAVVPGTFKKDKSREKLKSGEDGIAGDPRVRTDVTDAFDDLIIGIKYHGAGVSRIGGGLRGRFQNLAGILKR